MTVAAAKVKTVCTDSEVELVRDSRKPAIDKHSEAELKKLAARARKLFDKWQALTRQQARSRGRQAGRATSPENTQLKTQIFREALDAFEARLAKVSKSAAGKNAPAAGKSKKARTSEHQQSRAAVRTGMTAALDLKNQSRGKRADSDGAPSSAAEAASQTEEDIAAKQRSSSRSSTRKPTPKVTSKKPAPSKPPAAGKQLRASVVAKEKRLKQSGKTTRILGHVSARGKRAQARRDSKN